MATLETTHTPTLRLLHHKERETRAIKRQKRNRNRSLTRLLVYGNNYTGSTASVYLTHYEAGRQREKLTGKKKLFWKGSGKESRK